MQNQMVAMKSVANFSSADRSDATLRNTWKEYAYLYIYEILFLIIQILWYSILYKYFSMFTLHHKSNIS